MNASKNAPRLTTGSSPVVDVNNHTSVIELQPVALYNQSKSTCETMQGLGEVDANSGPDVRNETSEEAQNITGRRFVILFACLLLGNFFVGYLKDTSCIATLNPVITDQFQALNDLGWYTIAYLIAQASTTLAYGQLYSFYSMKTLYMLSFLNFVIGSVLSAAAPTSSAFIVGRAMSGLGAGGIFAGINIIVAHTTTLKHRPIYFAVCGSVECTALAFGPLISGTIAHYSTWRVCFYIIIPIGVVVIVTIFFCIEPLRKTENAHLSNREKLERIDVTGFAISVPMSLCLVLGLQWAGTAYRWSNWRVILLLALALVLLAIFLMAERRASEHGMIPLKMLRQRSVALASLITFCNFAALSVVSYYLPFYFQAVGGTTTLGSGLMYLPLALTMAITAFASGYITSFVGYYNPALVLGSIIMTIGAGLITTLKPNLIASRWISFQILYGLGVGLTFQTPYIAVQTVLHDSEVPTALVMLSFTQLFGGVVMLSIAQNVFLNRLVSYLAMAVPQLDPKIILKTGALGLVTAIPAKFREQALIAYNKALTDVFYIALGLACLVFVSSLGVEWKSVKKSKSN